MSRGFCLSKIYNFQIMIQRISNFYDHGGSPEHFLMWNEFMAVGKLRRQVGRDAYGCIFLF